MKVLITPTLKLDRGMGISLTPSMAVGKMYTEDQICNMIDLLVGNTFVKFGGGGGYSVNLLESVWE